MRDPGKYYGGMCNILLNYKDAAKTEGDIDKLLTDVCDVLRCWHEVFHILRAKERENHSFKSLEKAIECAGTRHRELELSVTPKVHMTEVHTKQQWVELPFSLFWVIEEFVEHNHQIGRKYEELKRIKNDEQRALAKAKQIWVSLHSEVQKLIQSTATRKPRAVQEKDNI
jgi:hypothetical protein